MIKLAAYCLVTCLVLFPLAGSVRAQTTAHDWRTHPASFDPPHWWAAKGSLDWWKIDGKKLSCTLSQSTPAWLLSGTPTSGSWVIEATFEPPFLYRDEGLLLN